jgi:hypothetical protein
LSSREVIPKFLLENFSVSISDAEHNHRSDIAEGRLMNFGPKLVDELLRQSQTEPILEFQTTGFSPDSRVQLRQDHTDLVV